MAYAIRSFHSFVSSEFPIRHSQRESHDYTTNFELILESNHAHTYIDIRVYMST